MEMENENSSIYHELELKRKEEMFVTFARNVHDKNVVELLTDFTFNNLKRLIINFCDFLRFAV